MHTKQWLQFWSTLFAMVTVGAAAVAIEHRWDVGSLGEWVSGLGSLVAVGAALWIAQDQRRQSEIQFQKERDHAMTVAAAEWEQQTIIREELEKRSQKERDNSDTKTISWLISSITPGFKTAFSYIKAVKDKPTYYNEYVRNALKSGHYISTCSIVKSINHSTFHSAELTTAVADAVRIWQKYVTFFEILSINTHFKEADIVEFASAFNCREDFVELVQTLMMATPNRTANEDQTKEIAETYVSHFF